MTIVESPQQYVRPLYQYMEGFDVEDYIDADAHRTDQAPDRRHVLIIDGFAYAPVPTYPLDYAWRRGA